jgi:hypothetical protein
MRIGVSGPLTRISARLQPLPVTGEKPHGARTDRPRPGRHYRPVGRPRRRPARTRHYRRPGPACRQDRRGSRALVARVREEAATLDLDPADLFGRRQKRLQWAPQGPGVALCRRNTAPRLVSNGRGKLPEWLAEHEAAGRTRDEFLVPEGQPDLIEGTRRHHGD